MKKDILQKKILEVGYSLRGEVCINGGPAAVDKNGLWHIIFTPLQAELMAKLLSKNAKEARKAIK